VVWGTDEMSWWFVTCVGGTNKEGTTSLKCEKYVCSKVACNNFELLQPELLSTLEIK